MRSPSNPRMSVTSGAMEPTAAEEANVLGAVAMANLVDTFILSLGSDEHPIDGELAKEARHLECLPLP